MPSAGKDRVVKYWDTDKFEHLLTLEGHCAEVGARSKHPAEQPLPATAASCQARRPH
jgi:hypothetical protein